MAIYTNYGRYLKAKQFKESLQERGDIYMVFGIGNPRWDYSTENKLSQGQMPIAPYNTSIISSDLVNYTNNQFYDENVSAFYWDNGSKYLLKDGKIVTEDGEDLDIAIKEKTYLSECKDIIPPFPCVWQNYTRYGDSSSSDKKLNYNPLLLSYNSGVGEIRQNSYQDYYILYRDGLYEVHDSTTSSLGTISVPSDQEESQYFSELYLRGLAINKGIRHPLGLLGAVKCDVSFVKDIGDDSSNAYTGSAKQFWYGDRYWEIVEPDETYVESYIGAKTHQEIYPHHLIITATVNPRNLCAELNIDQAIVPRQIAIYSRPLIGGNHSKNYYRVGENIFNFGQYTKSEWDAIDDVIPSDGEALNFALPCKFKPSDSESEVEYPGDPTTDFRFILHDYIKGSIREDKHAIDRFGYVIGF